MDPKEQALHALKNGFRAFEADLEAIPVEAVRRSFGGKSRTVADIVHEVNLVNDHICLALRKEPLFEWPTGWITAPPELAGKAEVLEAFRRSSAGVLSTIERMSAEQLAERITTEHGETDGYERARFMAWHVGYHSGQLNFIQTLLGDDAWHWS